MGYFCSFIMFLHNVVVPSHTLAGDGFSYLDLKCWCILLNPLEVDTM